MPRSAIRIQQAKPNKLSTFSAIRFSPGGDLRDSLENWCKGEKIDAAAIVSVVGSLEVASIRFAGADEPTTLVGPFEIVSCVGTLGSKGIHVHISLADKDGKVIGGHLCSGSTVYTTAEVVVCNLSEDWLFDRVLDSATGYPELDCVRKGK